MIDASNDWALRVGEGPAGERLYPAGLITTETVEGMINQARSLIERGIKTIWVPNGRPPADTSPADPALDPFWKLFEENNVSVVMHIGSDNEFNNPLWAANVPAFIPFAGRTAEFIMSPYWGSVMHLPAENYLSTMVLGGVFERFPNLRFGAIEYGAHWLGPLARNLDIWAKVFPKGLEGTLKMKPSEYIARNVRVAPFHFEDIANYLETYPELQDCYCFSTDYPHIEGGKYAKRTFAEKLSRFGPDIMKKFFVTNGAWLVPDRA
jgi:predicted TIM-barrel fold metal-dependent hydrolase